MSGTGLFSLAAAALVAIGLYGLVAAGGALRRILAFNVLGAGIFLVFGAIARRGAGAGFAGDPVPQALVITGIVVACAATALAVALVRRLAEIRLAEAHLAEARAAEAHAAKAGGDARPGREEGA